MTVRESLGKGSGGVSRSWGGGAGEEEEQEAELLVGELSRMLSSNSSSFTRQRFALISCLIFSFFLSEFFFVGFFFLCMCVCKCKFKYIVHICYICICIHI
jgi:hypothetical protein